MATLDELLEQRDDLLKKKGYLEKYQHDRRVILGEVSEITYRQKSGLHVTYEESERKKELERELKRKNAELKQHCQLTPASVPSQITEYHVALVKITGQLDELARLDESRQQLGELEDRLTETGVTLLAQQAGQRESCGYSRPSSQSKGDADREQQEHGGCDRDR